MSKTLLFNNFFRNSFLKVSNLSTLAVNSFHITSRNRYVSVFDNVFFAILFRYLYFVSRFEIFVRVN